MSVSENIFRILNERRISQKQFAQMIGVPESTISDWKQKGKSPSADRIMDICRALEVDPYDILLDKSEQVDYIKVDRDTELGQLVLEYNSLSLRQRDRIKGYIDGLLDYKE